MFVLATVYKGLLPCHPIVETVHRNVHQVLFNHNAPFGCAIPTYHSNQIIDAFVTIPVETFNLNVCQSYLKLSIATAVLHLQAEWGLRCVCVGPYHPTHPQLRCLSDRSVIVRQLRAQLCASATVRN